MPDKAGRENIYWKPLDGAELKSGCLRASDQFPIFLDAEW